MQKISESFDDYRSRWKKIEQICGFPITSPSPPHTRYPSTNHELDMEVSELCLDSHQKPSTSRSQYGSSSSLASSDSPSYGRDSPLLVGHTSVLPTGRGKSNSITSLSSSTHVASHGPQTAASQDSGISQDGNYVDFSPTFLRQSFVPVSRTTSLGYDQQGHEDGAFTSYTFRRSASTPLVRKSSYPKLVTATSSGGNSRTDGDIGITFLDPERNPKLNSGGTLTRRTNILGAIQEERSPLMARTHRQQSNGLDSVGEESDGSGSDKTKHPSRLRKNRKPSGQGKPSRSSSH